MPKVLKTSETPNPQARRFHLDTTLTTAGSRDFPTVESAQDHALAARLYELPEVAGVFFLGATVTVTKDDDKGWEELITPIADILEEREWGREGRDDTAGGEAGSAPALRGSGSGLAGKDFNREAMRQRVQQVLDARVRPGLQGDGGDLILVDCDASQVVVKYAGACGSCPTATTGTLTFIESALREGVHPDLTVHLIE